MKRGGGKRKGSAFEWKIARLLSAWIAPEDTTHSQLVPSIQSGGWARAGHRHLGDLVANGEAGEMFIQRFVIECKHHRSIDPFTYWTQKPQKNNLWGWWDLLQRTAHSSHHIPLLVFRSNGRPILVGTEGLAPGSYPSLHLPQLALTIVPLAELCARPFSVQLWKPRRRSLKKGACL